MESVDALCMIVDDGPLYDQLAAEITRRGLGDRVVLQGRLPQDEVKCLLHASGLFVLPSVTPNETFGIAQIEAMACGCAVVNTSLTTEVPLVARHGQEGLTVSPGDASALAAGGGGIRPDSVFDARGEDPPSSQRRARLTFGADDSIHARLASAAARL